MSAPAAMTPALSNRRREEFLLEKLNEVPWNELHHAYGTADDVPHLLRLLANGEQAEEALSGLYSNIWHQGTVYEASSHAVPFLFELAGESAVGSRADILGLIGALAQGASYLAVHAQPGNRFGERMQLDPGFENKLALEIEHVRRTRSEVFRFVDATRRMLSDPAPMVRAGAAFVLSRFPEHVSEFAPLIRDALRVESDALAASGMLWCLGAIGDDTQVARDMMLAALQDSSEPRRAFAAAAARYSIANQFEPESMPTYRKMASTPWFTSEYLNGVPWDFEIGLEEALSDIEPDPDGATESLLAIATSDAALRLTGASVVHDLLDLNFAEGKWRGSGHLNFMQLKILKCLVETNAAWEDVNRLWYLVPKEARKSGPPASSDIQAARDEMRAMVKRQTIG